MEECIKNNETNNKPFFFRKLKDAFKLRANKKNLLKKSVSSAAFLIVLACVFFFNLVVSILDNKFSLSLDLTRNKVFTISQSSLNFLKDIKKDVEIIVLNDEASFSESDKYFKQASSVIKQYSQKTDKIKISYIDTVKNPTYLKNQDFGNEKLSTNSIIVRSGGKYKVISVSDLFDISYGYYGAQGIKASKAEQELTSAILYVTSENQKKVAFLTGYDEADYSSFSELLKKNNYNVEEINLLTQEIPEDTSYAIIFAPSRDYDESGIKKLQNYINKENKNLMYAVNPELAKFSKIEEFLSNWNIKVKEGIVYETDASKMTSSRQIFEAVSEEVENSYTKKIKDAKIPVLLPVCRPLEALNKDSVKVLLQYSEKSGIMPPGVSNDFDIKGNICGPNPVALISEKNEENSKSTVTVLGSFVGLTQNYLLATSINNSSYFTCLLDSLTNKEDPGIIIEPKSIENEELGITGAQANILGLGMAAFLPLLVILFGVVVFVKRRNL